MEFTLKKKSHTPDQTFNRTGKNIVLACSECGVYYNKPKNRMAVKEQYELIWREAGEHWKKEHGF